MISAADSKHDLPLYPRLHPASRHDVVSLVIGTVEFTIDRILLDAAHDVEAIYLLLSHQGIELFIDLNVRSKKNRATGSDILLSPEGIPICPKGKRMKPNGFDQSQNRRKWRCTPAVRVPSTDERTIRSVVTICVSFPRRLAAQRSGS
jgi:hypothetical protein